jgi:high-affinity iron transporter
VFNTLVIALREGLEASLIVGILIAYLKKTGRVELLKSLWFGVFSAIGAALLFGAILTFTSTTLSENGEKYFVGFTGLSAVGLVTWMIFWMKKTARFMKLELEQKASAAISAGALSLAAFTAVVREGLETSLFLYANFKGNDPVGSTIGLLIGLGIAVSLGYGIYRGAIRFNLATFFKFSGAALVLVAANVFAYSLHELEEVGLFFEGSANKIAALLYIALVLPPYLSKAKPAKPSDVAAKIVLTK